MTMAEDINRNTILRSMKKKFQLPKRFQTVKDYLAKGGKIRKFDKKGKEIK